MFFLKRLPMKYPIDYSDVLCHWQENQSKFLVVRRAHVLKNQGKQKNYYPSLKLVKCPPHGYPACSRRPLLSKTGKLVSRYSGTLKDPSTTKAFLALLDSWMLIYHVPSTIASERNVSNRNTPPQWILWG